MSTHIHTSLVEHISNYFKKGITDSGTKMYAQTKWQVHSIKYSYFTNFLSHKIVPLNTPQKVPKYIALF